MASGIVAAEELVSEIVKKFPAKQGINREFHRNQA
jgi:hypothetical protein